MNDIDVALIEVDACAHEGAGVANDLDGKLEFTIWVGRAGWTRRTIGIGRDDEQLPEHRGGVPVIHDSEAVSFWPAARYPRRVDALLEAARDLFLATGHPGELRLIGGLAVRLHVGAFARATADIDLVAMNEATLDGLLVHLRSTGHEVVATGGWWRAVTGTATQLVIDVAQNPVMNPRTFEAVRLRAPPHVYEVLGASVAVAGIDDLALLKLLAGRDRDLIDLLLLAGTREVSAKAIARAAAEDDVERTLSGGAVQARHALRTGVLSSLFEEHFERAAERAHVDRLHRLLRELELEGL